METELDKRIRSRPVYEKVTLNDRAVFHLFIEEKESAEAESESSDLSESELKILFNHCASTQKSFLNFTLNELIHSLHLTSTATKLNTAFSNLPLASHLYVSGTEAFIWDVQKFALAAGLLAEQISLMQPISPARRVFCTHCYNVMQNVTHTPVVCTDCQLPLLVRDHFSRSHGAYVGLNINAENADDIPDQEALI